MIFLSFKVLLVCSSTLDQIIRHVFLFQLDPEDFIQVLETDGTWNEPQAIHLAADTFHFRPVIFVCPDATNYKSGTQPPKFPVVNIDRFADLDVRHDCSEYYFICDQEQHWRAVVPIVAKDGAKESPSKKGG
jgi:hypothetical protein